MKHIWPLKKQLGPHRVISGHRRSHLFLLRRCHWIAVWLFLSVAWKVWRCKVSQIVVLPTGLSNVVRRCKHQRQPINRLRECVRWALDKSVRKRAKEQIHSNPTVSLRPPWQCPTILEKGLCRTWKPKTHLLLLSEATRKKKMERSRALEKKAQNVYEGVGFLRWKTIFPEQRSLTWRLMAHGKDHSEGWEGQFT